MTNETDRDLPETQDGDNGVPVDDKGAAGLPYRIASQFISDLSFENPHGMRSLMPDQENPPEVKLGVNLKHRRAGKGQFEVLLLINAQTVRNDETLFIAELVYGGAVKFIQQVDKDRINEVLLREVPRYLYPFAREILADVTRRAGFPPLFLAPIDFDQMFENRKQQMPPVDGAEAAEPEAAEA